MRKLWNLSSSLIAMAILALVMLTVPQTRLNAQKGGAKGGGDGAAPSASQSAGLISGKNLRVLTPQNVDLAMQNITLALGVNCSYCHDMGNLPADTNPKKLKARMMLEMVRDINAKFGDQKTHVTCWTCHHATTEPQIAKPSAN
ncbi:MAG TPA: photosynthetic reaction center cytochrome c subunit family protein [Bryobacteraceae bacterium]|jgi:hypothetical protein